MGFANNIARDTGGAVAVFLSIVIIVGSTVLKFYAKEGVAICQLELKEIPL